VKPRSPHALLLICLGACSADPLGPLSGAHRVTAAVAGAGSDTDGFLVVLDRTVRRALTPESSVLLSAITPGQHVVALEGLGPNCRVEGEAERTVDITAGDTSETVFDVTCDAVGATLALTVQTTGEDLDPNGYTVLVDDLPVTAVEPDGSVLFGVAPGTRTVTLGGVNPNCAPTSSAQTVGIAVGGLLGLRFDVQCVAGSRSGRGREIVFTSSDPLTEERSLNVVNDDGSHRERIFPGFGEEHFAGEWARDGERLALYLYSTDSTQTLTVADAQRTVQFELEEERGPARAVAWTPDGSALALGSESFDCPLVTVLRLDGSPEQPLDVGCTSVTTVPSLSYSPDGARLAYVGWFQPEFSPPFNYLAVANLAVPGEVEFPVCEAVVDDLTLDHVAWSPDGSRLAFAADGIYLLDPVTSECTRLTAEPGDGHPSWSPDGSRIAFSSQRDGNGEIYVMNVDGTGQTRITRSPSEDFAPSWRP
jgi:dipeptidyl aminopeptidase/acylaminoacyl peptidase